jgi:hypothetical protein
MDDESDLPHLRPLHTGTGIEIDPQLVRMVQIAGSHGVRVEVDAGQVDDPRQRGGVIDDHLVGGAPGREGELYRSDVWRQVLGRALLEERLTIGALDEALERHGPIADAHQRAVRDAHVVLDELELRDPGLREEDLRWVGDRDLVPVEVEDLRLRPRHGHSVASSARCRARSASAHTRHAICAAKGDDPWSTACAT